jgi:hypothetical protein
VLVVQIDLAYGCVRWVGDRFSCTRTARNGEKKNLTILSMAQLMFLLRAFSFSASAFALMCLKSKLGRGIAVESARVNCCKRSI